MNKYTLYKWLDMANKVWTEEQKCIQFDEIYVCCLPVEPVSNGVSTVVGSAENCNNSTNGQARTR